MSKKRSPLKRAKDFALYVTMRKGINENPRFTLGGLVTSFCVFQRVYAWRIQSTRFSRALS
ncbi:hypothetical protein FB005_10859 [Sinorhizobium medicae]|nr:hypothetical protein FB006_10859 [Sinorhizobium medicae]TWA43727.1 hypothetical protein FB005_10859 [Sinorhizobium medicae]TWA52050.1 hypothetical protein FB008_108167 [Sinorhizobium medicae]